MIVRELNEDDWSLYRELRLHALETEGEWFGPTYETEKEYPISDWRHRCQSSPTQCLFGLFDREKLVGAFSARRWEEDPTGNTALWGAAYVRPEYRGKGYARDLYIARTAWTKDHGFQSAMLFIRKGNKRSTEIHSKHGAIYEKTEEMSWPGRPSSTWHWYKVPLRNTGLDPLQALENELNALLAIPSEPAPAAPRLLVLQK
jgi:RimJ/RimL family protein N-acetyltransferase